MKKIFFSYVISFLALGIAIFAVFNNNHKDEIVYNDNNVEFKINNGYLMWRHVEDDKWNKLLDLATIKGNDGTNGKDGKDGINGLNGKDGANGKDGINGSNGVNGKNGTNGKDGKDGKDGREIELKFDNNTLYWKYTSDTEWIELFKFSNINTGDNDNDDDDDGGNTGSDSDFDIDVACFKNKTVCDSGTAVQIAVNDNETLDFYVVSDDNTHVTLISKNNIGNDDIKTLKWYEATSGNTNYGPVSLITSLNELTKNWTNVNPISTYEYDNSGVGYKKMTIINGVATFTDSSNGNVILSESVSRARLLTYEEAKALGCTTSKNSCPSWLYENLSAETNTLTPYGYWLLTTYSNTNAYNIRNTGMLSNNSAGDATGRGIRPVITIKK